jgi:ribonuclease R
MSKKKKKSSAGNNQVDLKNRLLEIFESRPGKQFNFKQVQKKLIHFATKDEIGRALNELIEKNIVKVNEFGKFTMKNPPKQKSKKPSNIITGIVDLTATGNAYIISKETDQDIFVHARHVGQVFDGDRVKVAVFKRKNKRPEGEILEVVSRSMHSIVGTLELSNGYGFVIPDKRKVPVDVFIPVQMLNGAKNGDRVIVRIVEWEKGKKSPMGEIIERLGSIGDNDTEMRTIIAQSGFPLHFSNETNHELSQMNFEITGEEIKNRKDFRGITTFTIDPVDAKDFDDAISIRKLESGNWEIGVHIADVSHYVKPGSALDKDAYQRATSVYLVDRVLPMIPEELSNVVCSLRPDEEKLCFSAVFEMNAKAKVVKRWFGRTIIKSDRRFTYEEVQEILENGKGDFAGELQELNQLAYKLRDERFDHGAISFETIEIKFRMDEQGVPVGVYVKERKDAHKLIEDFMLLANKEVATFAKSKGLPFVYRIHDQPDMEKLIDFQRFAAQFGYTLQIDTPGQISASLNKLMEEIKGKPEQDLLEQLAIRSMAKAVYSTHNIGHYGLAFSYYTHFTSPIRRYPDILVHRLLQSLLDPKQQSYKPNNLESMCEHCSWMERKAMDAERESQKYKQVEFIQSHVGESFDALISGVVHFGLFVEIIENKCEGLVDIDSIKGDYFIFFEKENAIIGSQTGKRYRLGDKVKVKVIKADLEKRRIDFELITD